jgi:hypothetical protein
MKIKSHRENKTEIPKNQLNKIKLLELIEAFSSVGFLSHIFILMFYYEKKLTNIIFYKLLNQLN